MITESIDLKREDVLLLSSSSAPALSVIPLLTTPIAVDYHSPREIGVALKSISFIQDGFNAFFTVTPIEMYSSLHPYAIINIPGMLLGYAEAGRLTSLMIAIGTAVSVGLIARTVVDWRVGVLAPVMLWAQPLFYRHSYLVMPEILSIGLTTFSVLLMVKYHISDQVRWYLISLFTMSLSITNHMWEATIALPLVTICMYRRDWIRGIGVGVGAVTSVVVVYLITEIQPTGPSTLTGYSILAPNAKYALLSLDYWFLYIPRSHPFPLSLGITFLGSFVLIIYLYRVLEQDRFFSILIISWIVSALAIPLFLPNGFMAHQYYMWPFPVPVALGGSYILTQMLESSDSITTDQSYKYIRYIVLFLTVSAVLYGLIFELGIAGGSDIPVLTEINGASNDLPEDIDSSEPVETGSEIRSLGITNSSKIAFVGNWGTPPYFGPAGEVLVYSRLPVNEVFSTSSGSGPQFVQDTSELPSDCEVYVTMENNELEVNRCPR